VGRHLKTVEDEQIKLAIMTANNHYAGFGPVNIFRNILGQQQPLCRVQARDREYTREYVRVARGQMGKKEEDDGQQKHLERYPTSDSKQRTLSDFIN